MEVLENEDEQFRQKIEKLREHAGESWLTVYNEMNVDPKQQQVIVVVFFLRATHSELVKTKVSDKLFIL